MLTTIGSFDRVVNPLGWSVSNVVRNLLVVVTKILTREVKFA